MMLMASASKEKDMFLKERLLIMGSSVGSGVSEKDRVDCEDQFPIKKRSLQWSPSFFTVLTVEARRG